MSVIGSPGTSGSMPRRTANSACPERFRSPTSVWTNGPAETTRGCSRTRSATWGQSSRTITSPYWVTQMCGLVPRIFSRSSVCRPLITEVTTMSAITPTVTPTMEMRVMRDRNFPPRRDAR
jgi:hypothetical protein